MTTEVWMSHVTQACLRVVFLFCLNKNWRVFVISYTNSTGHHKHVQTRPTQPEPYVVFKKTEGRFSKGGWRAIWPFYLCCRLSRNKTTSS